MKDFSKLCTPAKIYFGIAAIATLFDLLNGVSLMFAFWKLVFAFVWTFILGGLCDKGYKSISWALVLLPYILMFLASLNIYHVTDEQRQFMRSIQLQGAFGQEAFKERLGEMKSGDVLIDNKKAILMAKRSKIQSEIQTLRTELESVTSESNRLNTMIKGKEEELKQIDLELKALK